MIKRLPTLFICVLVAVAFIAASVDAKSNFDKGKRVVDERTNKVTTFSFSGKRHLVAQDDVPELLTPTTSSAVRSSLGVPATAGQSASPGFTVDVSYNDDQYIPSAGHQVEWRGTSPYVQFAYGNANSKGDISRFGYNVYDPVLGNWPRTAEVGCEIQGAGDIGTQVDMSLNSSGFVVIGGVDGTTTATQDNHFFFQTAKFSCTWGTGTKIAASQYNVNFLTTANLLHHPRIESQTWAGQTYTHVVAVESKVTDLTTEFRRNTLHYFRKVGTAQAGTWTGPVTLDTIASSSNSQRVNCASIVASRTSPKVAVVYTVPTAEGLAHLQRYDNDVYFTESDSVGATWGARVNMTNYTHTTASFTANLGAFGLYDSQGFLHILFSAQPVDALPYAPTSSFFWGDFSCSLFHWSKRVAGSNAGGTIAKVHNAEWGIDVNTEVCGFPSPGSSYLGFYSLAECDGRLYAVFSQYNDYYGNFGTSHIDDCAVGASDRLYAANGEVCVTVSSDRDGMLWDAVRNLTNTYTPNCDSAGGTGGECANDTRATVSRYGMNVNSFDTNAVHVNLTWPGTDLIVPAGGTADSMFLHVFYTADKFPAPGWRDTTTYNRATPNPLKWMRLACVDPISAPQIRVSPNLIAYPEYTRHNTQKSVTVTVTNEGNEDLHVTTIGTDKVSPITPNWLATSVGSLTVAAGQSNTGTFNVLLNGPGLINSPGTVVALNGEVYLLSDAPAPRDSVSIFIENFLVADTVVGLDFDTVVTCGVELMVDNHGNMGSQGQGKVNLDFVGSGECDTSGADTYLYDGGPMLIRNLGGGSFVYSNALFEDDFSTAQSFKPLTGPVPASFVGPAGSDGYFTGTFVTRDTAVGMQLRYYGPTDGGDNCDFVIQQMKVFKMTPGTLTGITVGQGIDWDIRSDSGAQNSFNRSGVATDSSFVYQRGVDTGAVTGCNPDSGRYGAQAVLGMYLKSDSVANNCATSNIYGMYAQYNDTLFKYDTLSENLEANFYWNEMGIAGYRSRAGVRDFHMITTYKYNTSLSNTDTLTCWTVMTSVRNGTLTDLAANVAAAKAWFFANLRPGCGSCCVGSVGNIDGDITDGVDVGDLTKLINNLFITFEAIACPAEANCDGDPLNSVDVGDLTALINNLFITFAPLPACQ